MLSKVLRLCLFLFFKCLHGTAKCWVAGHAFDVLSRGRVEKHALFEDQWHAGRSFVWWTSWSTATLEGLTSTHRRSPLLRLGWFLKKGRKVKLGKGHLFSSLFFFLVARKEECIAAAEVTQGLATIPNFAPFLDWLKLLQLSLITFALASHLLWKSVILKHCSHQHENVPLEICYPLTKIRSLILSCLPMHGWQTSWQWP